MQEISQVTGTGVPMLIDDVDTDRIIPARYLRCVTFDGLGQHVFEDDRLQDPNHPFDDPRFQGGSILVTGRNFGCGSSREHAPQALMRWGIRAIVAESFAEIFFGNCTSLGIPAVTAARTDLQRLADVIAAKPATEITVDLSAKQVCFADQTIACEIPEEARSALLTGQWDFLAQLLKTEEAIRQTAARLPYLNDFVGC
ncbi:MAG: 3-isopropylmalate dehydratase small subunit [Planctomycetes bacterium]|nr:3-isopropylmalate dehydratase small subunit [Planctomycetota bacterium]